MPSLFEIIADLIERQGPMDVGTFMGLALGHPQYGYYMRRDPFGASGDFTTAPEISQMFGEMVGAWVADLWLRMDRPSLFTLVEAGPGRGTLMADLLRATRNIQGFRQSMSVHFLEMSPVLKESQALAIGGNQATWHESTEDMLSAGQGPFFLIANEFLDALPVRQLQYDGHRWRERLIGMSKAGTLEFTIGEVSDFTGNDIPSSPQIDDIFEIAPARSEFIQAVCGALKRRGGAMLLIDYGHAIPGFGDTLQAVRAHEFAQILNAPGEADLTSHVDFASLAAVARQNGCMVHGPVSQGLFLMSLGIAARAEKLSSAAKNDEQLNDIRSALQRLTASDQMGSLFKVMAITPNDVLSPAGFLAHPEGAL